MEGGVGGAVDPDARGGARGAASSAPTKNLFGSSADHAVLAMYHVRQYSNYLFTVSVEGDDPMHLTAKGTLEDGRLLRVEPVDPAAYSDLVDHSR